MPAWRLLANLFPTTPLAPVPHGYGLVKLTKAEMCQAEWMWQTLQLSCSGSFDVDISDIGISGSANFDAGTNASSTPNLVADWRGLIGVQRNFGINYTQTIPGFLPFPYDSDWLVQYSAQWSGPVYYDPPFDSSLFTKLLACGVTVSTSFNTDEPFTTQASGAPDPTGGDFSSLILGNSIPGTIINDDITTLTIFDMQLANITTIPAPPDF